MKSYLRLLLFVPFLFLACAMAEVHYDYDPDAAFVSMKAYDWIPEPKKMKRDAFVLKRIHKSVDDVLAAKGFSQSRETPDFLVAAYVAHERKVDMQEWGYVYKHKTFYRNYEFVRGVDAYEYEVGTLIIDIVEPGTKSLIWRGSSSEVTDPSLTPEQRDQEVARAVSAVLANFPPPSAAPARQSPAK